MRGRKNKKRAWGKLLRRLNCQGVTPVYFNSKCQKASHSKGREGHVTRQHNSQVRCLTVQKVWHMPVFQSFILRQCQVL